MLMILSSWASMVVCGWQWLGFVVVIDLDSRFFKRARLFSFFPAFRLEVGGGSGWIGRNR